MFNAFHTKNAAQSGVTFQSLLEISFINLIFKMASIELTGRDEHDGNSLGVDGAQIDDQFRLLQNADCPIPERICVHSFEWSLKFAVKLIQRTPNLNNTNSNKCTTFKKMPIEWWGKNSLTFGEDLDYRPTVSRSTITV